eukprot:scaffold13534_cov69-Cylindrotheca_fusiformis.AAC.3
MELSGPGAIRHNPGEESRSDNKGQLIKRSKCAHWKTEKLSDGQEAKDGAGKAKAKNRNSGQLAVLIDHEHAKSAALISVVVVFILTQLQTEHALAFGFLQQPTRRLSQSSSHFEPLFARSYDRAANNEGRARKANHHQRNRGPPNAVNPQDLVQQVRSSRNCFELGKVLRENPSLFFSENSIRALIPKVAELKPRMSALDLAGLLNALSKARVSECICQNGPSASNAVRRSCKNGHSNY